MIEKFKLFCKENPLDFDTEQFKKIENDILNKKHVVCDLESKKFSKKITLAHSFMVFLSSQH